MRLSLLLIGLSATVTLAPAQTILQVTSGTGTAGPEYFGQSFTTPSGGPWNSITFNFYSTPAPVSTPAAAGTAFLLTEEYLGTPAALSSSTPGYLAQSTSISGGVYVFPSSVVLNPVTKYWIYGNAAMVTTGSGTGGSPAGAAYFAGSSTTNFSAVGGGQVVNYNLSSGPVSTTPGQTILQVTYGTGTSEPSYFGQSFTMPSGGTWNNITFNFYSTPAGPATPASTPAAAGTAFLLTEEYLGTPAALSSSTPGYLAQSTSISGGMYIFPPGVVLSPGTKYWIYENGSMITTGSGTGGSPAGAAYFANTATSNFDPSGGGQVTNYNLSSGALSVTAVPPSFPLTVVGLLCVGLYLTRRRLVRQA